MFYKHFWLSFIIYRAREILHDISQSGDVDAEADDDVGDPDLHLPSGSSTEEEEEEDDNLVNEEDEDFNLEDSEEELRTKKRRRFVKKTVLKSTTNMMNRSRTGLCCKVV